jgi:hypothetical protein
VGKNTLFEDRLGKGEECAAGRRNAPSNCNIDNEMESIWEIAQGTGSSKLLHASSKPVRLRTLRKGAPSLTTSESD